MEETRRFTETTIGVDGQSSVVTETVSTLIRVAVVKATPRKWYAQVWTKITAAVTGNIFFLWVWGQLETIRGFEFPTFVWKAVFGMIGVGSLIWIGNEIWETHRYNNFQEELDKLLVEQNSTPDNLAQLIPADEVELYRARGFKIVTRGEKA